MVGVVDIQGCLRLEMEFPVENKKNKSIVEKYCRDILKKNVKTM